ncbi:phage tail protein [Pseudoalteromonas sp. Of7M-16]|uniref:phage tail-collar fiber domain-containing protein n=1 Tax=Pseudoalteromonas sp. Of7M-16 TaxID=2917756 RepID=UPI001EF50007|nr:phage tail protein [Pseudoalteromonas sp. Of7M-16]MCG7548438.1 phage tail protein [Pseudoalteromonas sp. Of7M-16]
MSALTLQFTQVGLDALLAAKANGKKAQISHMAFGDASYTPSQTQTSLQNLRELQQIREDNYEVGENHQVTVVALFDKTTSAPEYAIREVGVYIQIDEPAGSDNNLILLGVYSEPNRTLGYRTPDVKILQSVTLSLAQLPSDSVEIKPGIDNLNMLIDNELADLTLVQLDTMHRQLKQELRLAALEKLQ